MVSKIVGRSVVVQAMATVMCGSMEAVPEGKARDNVSQLMVGLVVRSVGNELKYSATCRGSLAIRSKIQAPQ